MRKTLTGSRGQRKQACRHGRREMAGATNALATDRDYEPWFQNPELRGRPRKVACRVAWNCRRPSPTRAGNGSQHQCAGSRSFRMFELTGATLRCTPSTPEQASAVCTELHFKSSGRFSISYGLVPEKPGVACWLVREAYKRVRGVV